MRLFRRNRAPKPLTPEQQLEADLGAARKAQAAALGHLATRRAAHAAAAGRPGDVYERFGASEDVARAMAAAVERTDELVALERQKLLGTAEQRQAVADARDFTERVGRWTADILGTDGVAPNFKITRPRPGRVVHRADGTRRVVGSGVETVAEGWLLGEEAEPLVIRDYTNGRPGKALLPGAGSRNRVFYQGVMLCTDGSLRGFADYESHLPPRAGESITLPNPDSHVMSYQEFREAHNDTPPSVAPEYAAQQAMTTLLAQNRSFGP